MPPPNPPSLPLPTPSIPPLPKSPLLAVYYSVFDDVAGPKVFCCYPPGSLDSTLINQRSSSYLFPHVQRRRSRSRSRPLSTSSSSFSTTPPSPSPPNYPPTPTSYFRVSASDQILRQRGVRRKVPSHDEQSPEHNNWACNTIITKFVSAWVNHHLPRRSSASRAAARPPPSSPSCPYHLARLNLRQMNFPSPLFRSPAAPPLPPNATTVFAALKDYIITSSHLAKGGTVCVSIPGAVINDDDDVGDGRAAAAPPLPTPPASSSPPLPSSSVLSSLPSLSPLLSSASQYCLSRSCKVIGAPVHITDYSGKYTRNALMYNVGVVIFNEDDDGDDGGGRYYDDAAEEDDASEDDEDVDESGGDSLSSPSPSSFPPGWCPPSFSRSTSSSRASASASRPRRRSSPPSSSASFSPTADYAAVVQKLAAVLKDCELDYSYLTKQRQGPAAGKSKSTGEKNSNVANQQTLWESDGESDSDKEEVEAEAGRDPSSNAKVSQQEGTGTDAPGESGLTLIRSSSSASSTASQVPVALVRENSSSGGGAQAAVAPPAAPLLSRRQTVVSVSSMINPTIIRNPSNTVATPATSASLQRESTSSSMSINVSATDTVPATSGSTSPRFVTGAPLPPGSAAVPPPSSSTAASRTPASGSSQLSSFPPTLASATSTTLNASGVAVTTTAHAPSASLFFGVERGPPEPEAARPTLSIQALLRKIFWALNEEAEFNMELDEANVLNLRVTRLPDAPPDEIVDGSSSLQPPSPLLTSLPKHGSDGARSSSPLPKHLAGKSAKTSSAGSTTGSLTSTSSDSYRSAKNALRRQAAVLRRRRSALLAKEALLVPPCGSIPPHILDYEVPVLVDAQTIVPGGVGASPGFFGLQQLFNSSNSNAVNSLHDCDLTISWILPFLSTVPTANDLAFLPTPQTLLTIATKSDVDKSSAEHSLRILRYYGLVSCVDQFDADNRYEVTEAGLDKVRLLMLSKEEGNLEVLREALRRGVAASSNQEQPERPDMTRSDSFVASSTNPQQFTSLLRSLSKEWIFGQRVPFHPHAAKGANYSGSANSSFAGGALGSAQNSASSHSIAGAIQDAAALSGMRPSILTPSPADTRRSSRPELSVGGVQNAVPRKGSNPAMRSTKSFAAAVLSGLPSSTAALQNSGSAQRPITNDDSDALSFLGSFELGADVHTPAPNTSVFESDRLEPGNRSSSSLKPQQGEVANPVTPTHEELVRKRSAALVALTNSTPLDFFSLFCLFDRATSVGSILQKRKVATTPTAQQREQHVPELLHLLDPQKLITYGVLNGLIRRVHNFPVCVQKNRASPSHVSSSTYNSLSCVRTEAPQFASTSKAKRGGLSSSVSMINLAALNQQQNVGASADHVASSTSNNKYSKEYVVLLRSTLDGSRSDDRLRSIFDLKVGEIRAIIGESHEVIDIWI